MELVECLMIVQVGNVKEPQTTEVFPQEKHWRMGWVLQVPGIGHPGMGEWELIPGNGQVPRSQSVIRQRSLEWIHKRYHSRNVLLELGRYLSRHENLSLDSQHPYKNLHEAAHMYNSSTRERKQVDTWTSLGRQVRWLNELHVHWELLSKKWAGKRLRKIP